MLIIVKEVKGSRLVVTRFSDDSKLADATELAQGLVRHDSKIKRVCIYLKSSGCKPVLLRKVGKILGRIKVR